MGHHVPVLFQLEITGLVDERIFIAGENRSVERLCNEIKGMLKQEVPITILLNDNLRAEVDRNVSKYKEDTKNLRLLNIDISNCFYGRLSFGFMYGSLEEVKKEQVIRILRVFGIEKTIDEVGAMLRGLYFTVQLIRIKQVLESYRETRIAINISA